MATLSDFDHIRTATFVKIDIEEYWDGSQFIQQTLAFSDHFTDFLFGGNTYTALGSLMDVTSTFSDLQTSTDSVTVVVTGIPNRSIEEIVKSKIKAEPVAIYRGFFNQDGTLITGLNFANPLQRFLGYVNNYTLQEDWDAETRTSTNTIALDIGSQVDVIQRKVSGRKTNPTNMDRYYPDDKSFDNVPALVDQKVNFGE